MRAKICEADFWLLGVALCHGLLRGFGSLVIAQNFANTEYCHGHSETKHIATWPCLRETAELYM